MKQKIISSFRNILFKKIIGSKQSEKIIIFLAKLAGVSLRRLYYQEQGILKYQSSKLSGETYLINSILPKYLNKNAIIFDVGANVGKYTDQLRKQFPNSIIYAFEPSSYSFTILQENTKNDPKIKSYQKGLSSLSSTKNLYDYGNMSGTSSQATLYPEIFEEFKQHKFSNEVYTKKETIEMTSIDDFCLSSNIDCINFIKIDTEGHEIEVLKGSQKMIQNKKIKIIQFEFNEMNVISRVFLKDFYDLLSSYYFFRLDSNRLIPIFTYNTNNEIFKFQNILAIQKDIYENQTI